jgi:hypothetical protein
MLPQKPVDGLGCAGISLCVDRGMWLYRYLKAGEEGANWLLRGMLVFVLELVV